MMLLGTETAASQRLYDESALSGGTTRLERVGAYVVVIIVVGQPAPRFGIC